jgi:hypothetical protein
LISAASWRMIFCISEWRPCHARPAVPTVLGE